MTKSLALHYPEMAFKARNLILLSFSCFLLFVWPTYSQTNTIMRDQRLKYEQELISASGIFKLGFFNSDTENNSYVGIWYKGDDKHVVWVANRNTPITGNSGVLTIDGDGNLKILHDGGVPVVIYYVEVASNTSAILQDDGNFVLREVNSDGTVKRNLWQSFDYPTDTLLPGMKLGINLKTGHNWSLTSWRYTGFPAEGSFTLGMDPNGTNQMIIWWRGNIYWTSGLWDNGSFPFSDYIFYGYQFSYISNENEKFFNYSLDHSVSTIPKLKIDYLGTLLSSQQDDMTEILCCRPWRSTSPRCIEQNFYMCRRPEFTFIQSFIIGNGFKISLSENLTDYDCALLCYKNCSCVAYACSPTNFSCEIWNRGATLITTSIANDTRFMYVLDHLESRANKWWIWLIVAGVLTIALFFCYVKISRIYKTKGKKKMKQKILLNELGGNAMASTIYRKAKRDGKTSDLLQVFSFESIVAATNNFSTANKLGEGGFGPVYKGKLIDGREAAIKRLSTSSGQGLAEFKNEAILIAKLQHTNLVRLLGFCIEEEEKILIYEYMPNKSLDFFLFDSTEKNKLNWRKRFEIIEGVAQGLVYLHKYSRLRVIHRDLKASNILLDDQLNPKISDFGMARILGLNESESNTNRIVGTYGYMCPEYALNGNVSVKTDVFSFGVLLLEIVSSKKNKSCYHSEHPLNLIEYAWQLWNEGRGLELIDPMVYESCPHKEILRCIHVSLLCVQNHAIDRPTMPDVVSMLSNDTIPLPVPKEPTFFINTVVEESNSPKNKSDSCSINQVSISVMEAR